MTVRAGRWVSDMPYPPGRSVEQTGARSSLRGTGGRRVVRAPADAGRSKFEQPAARAGSYFLPRGDSARGRPFARCSRPEPLGFVYPYRLDQASYDRMRLVEKRRTTDVWRTIYDMHGLDMKELEEEGGRPGRKCCRRQGAHTFSLWHSASEQWPNQIRFTAIRSSTHRPRTAPAILVCLS
jgi:hypothetical protein